MSRTEVRVYNTIDTCTGGDLEENNYREEYKGDKYLYIFSVSKEILILQHSRQSETQSET